MTQFGAFPANAEPKVVFYEQKTWTLMDAVLVPSGSDFLLGGERERVLAPNQSLRVVAAYGELWNGSASASFTWRLLRRAWGGAEAAPTGWTGLVVPLGSLTTDGTEFSPTPFALADKDRIRPEVTAVANSPKNGFVTVTLEHTVLLGS